MKKRMIIMIITLIIVFGGLIGFNLFKQYKTAQFFETFKMPPATISTIIAQKENWQPTISAIGNFKAVNGVDVNAQQSGHVTKIQFSSGDYVKKGQLLLELDQSIEQASLAEAKANLSLATSNYQRQQLLYKKLATSTSSLDSANANLLQAQASVDKIQAIINQKNIRAPFDGKLGVRLVNVGQFVSPGNTKLVTLQSQDPLFLHFYLPEHYLTDLKRKQEIIFSVRGYKNHSFRGEIQALNSKVDSNTHNVLIQAQVANCPHPDDLGQQTDLLKMDHTEEVGANIYQCDSLLNIKHKVKEFAFIPGMFSNIEVMQPLQKNVLVLPRTAINYSLYGNSVYLVKKEIDPITKESGLKVFQKFVKTGDERGSKIVILSGINAGDEIVNSGQLKLQNGTDVLINNKIQLNTTVNVKTLGQ
tara:strand:+ start:198 stop:1448 length:1251 start_codon:yes stop_codon:yes gene_type:complete